jgi:hypothetical protein
MKNIKNIHYNIVTSVIKYNNTDLYKYIIIKEK